MADAPSTGAARLPIAIRVIAVALLLLTAVSSTAFAKATDVISQSSTPTTSGSGSGGLLAAIPEDTVSYVDFNLDPNSQQVRDSSHLATMAGLDQLLPLLDTSASEPGTQNPVLSMLQALGVTELGVAMSAADLESAMLTSSTSSPLSSVPTLLVLRSSDSATTYRSTVQFIEAYVGVGAGQVSTSDYHGHEVTRIPVTAASPNGPAAVTLAGPSASTMASSDAAATSGSASQEIYLSDVGGLVIVSSGETSIQGSLDTFDGSNPSLSESSDFQKVSDKLAGPSLVFSYADSAAMYSSPLFTDLLDLLGLDPSLFASLNVVTGARIWADTGAPGFRIDTAQFPASNAVATPAATPSFSSEMTTRVPGTTMIYIGGNDIGAQLVPIAAIAIAGGYVSDSSSMSGGSDNARIELAQLGATVDIMTGYLRLFSGEYVVAIDPGSFIETGDPADVFAVAATHVDGESFTGGLLAAATRYIQASGGSDVSVSTAVVNGTTVTTVTSLDPSGPPVSVSYAQVNGELVVGYGDSVSVYLGGVSDSLADNAQFQQTFDALGKSPSDGAVVYLDLTRLLPLLQMTGDVALGSYSSGSTTACASGPLPYPSPVPSGSSGSSAIGNQGGDNCETTSSESTPSVMLSDYDLSGILSYGQVTYAGDGGVMSNGLILLQDNS